MSPGGFSQCVWAADVATNQEWGNRRESRLGRAVWGVNESEVLAEHQGETSGEAGLGLRESKGQEALGSACLPNVLR